MIQSLRISIGDITYENVNIILSDEIEEHGFDPIFECECHILYHMSE